MAKENQIKVVISSRKAGEEQFAERDSLVRKLPISDAALEKLIGEIRSRALGCNVEVAEAPPTPAVQPDKSAKAKKSSAKK